MDTSYPGVTTYDPFENHHEIDLTIIVPCYNESRYITETLDCLTQACHEAGHSYEILVVDDASKDKTSAIVQDYQKKYPNEPIVLKTHSKNRGLSRTYVDGAFIGKGKYYRLVCGDNCETKDSLVRVLKLLGKADMIIPYHPVVPGKSWLRLLISKTYTQLVNLITGNELKYYNGCPLHLRYNVMRWGSYSFGFGFQAELTTRLLDEGATYLEVPMEVYHHENDASASAFNWRNILSVTHALVEMLARRIRKKIFKR